MNRMYPLLIFLVLNTCLCAQNASTSDCLGAIPICQQVYSETNSPVGGGDVLEINIEYNCMQIESNSVWYSFTVNNSGDFGFLLTPNNLEDDYDWALFDITNASCEDLFDNPELIVSCNAAGGFGCHGLTGATGESEFNIQGAGCTNTPSVSFGYSPLNALIPVQEGNTYVLCVSNWTGSPYGYSIDFGLSEDIGIFDDTPPEIEEIIYPEDCGDTVFTIIFSEYIQCSSISAGNFQLLGSDGHYDLSLSASNCDANGNFDKYFTLSVSPFLSKGDYSLILNVDGETEVLDLCDNPAKRYDVSFSSKADCEYCDVFVPNAFSPNNDGINDLFKPYSDCELFEFNLKVFDRWGGLVLESNDPSKGWDGKTNTRRNDLGIYTWKMIFKMKEYNKSRTIRLSGDLLLMK